MTKQTNVVLELGVASLLRSDVEVKPSEDGEGVSEAGRRCPQGRLAVRGCLRLALSNRDEASSLFWLP